MLKEDEILDVIMKNDDRKCHAVNLCDWQMRKAAKTTLRLL